MHLLSDELKNSSSRCSDTSDGVKGENNAPTHQALINGKVVSTPIGASQVKLSHDSPNARHCFSSDASPDLADSAYKCIAVKPLAASNMTEGGSGCSVSGHDCGVCVVQ